MPPPLTRVLTAIALAAVVCLTAQTLFFAYFGGDVGVTFDVQFGTETQNYHVTAIDREQKLPLVVGDVLSLPDLSFGNRMRFMRGRIGDTFVFVRKRGNLPVTLTVGRVRHVPLYALVLPLIGLAMAACAAAIVARRWNAVEARALAYFLTGFGLVFANQPAPWYPDWLVFASVIGTLAVQVTALAHAVRFATLFPDPHARGVRRYVRLVNRVLGPAYLALGVGAAAFTGLTLQRIPHALAWFINSSSLYFVVATTLAFTMANIRAAGDEKTRVRWVSLSIAAGFTGPLVGVAGVLIFRTFAEWQAYANLTLVAIPLGTAYAIVRHRVLDIAFAVNRAIAFSLVSGFVVVAFALLEWFLGKVVVDASHITSTSLEMLLALILGFSLRVIHRRAEGLVDDLFFRTRHESLARLRLFAEEVRFIDDLGILVERTVAAVVREEGASRCALYLASGDGAFEAAAMHGDLLARIDANDPVVVRARATHAPVDVPAVRSSLDAEAVYPLFVRDALIGMLACGARDDAETYAPDERAALEAIARALAAAIDSLQIAAMRRDLESLMATARPMLADVSAEAAATARVTRAS